MKNISDELAIVQASPAMPSRGERQVLPLRQRASDLALLLDLHAHAHSGKKAAVGAITRMTTNNTMRSHAASFRPPPASVAGGQDELQILQHTGGCPQMRSP